MATPIAGGTRAASITPTSEIPAANDAEPYILKRAASVRQLTNRSWQRMSAIGPKRTLLLWSILLVKASAAG
jgi:hypothetical protein